VPLARTRQQPKRDVTKAGVVGSPRRRTLARDLHVDLVRNASTEGVRHDVELVGLRGAEQADG
jgi:hypothetical protein